MKLYFVRHGESVANILREFSNSGVKHPLTEKGIEQAQLLAHQLADIQFERIYSSPVLRALQTARIVADKRGLDVEVTEALREWNVGIYEGTTDPRGWKLHGSVQADWFFHHKPESKMPGGENLIEIKDRFVPFIDGLVQRYRHTDHNILCVAHGGLYMAMLPVIFKNIDHAFANEHGVAHTTPTIGEIHLDGLYCTSWCGILMAAS
jgi:broad specificity phosphatase PhoE